MVHPGDKTAHQTKPYYGSGTPTPAQAMLEAEVFLALRILVDRTQLDWDLPRGFGIQSTHVSAHHMLVYSDPESTARAIADILPATHDSVLHGVPGLRIRDGQRGAIVHLIGSTGELEFAATSTAEIWSIYRDEYGGLSHSSQSQQPHQLTHRELAARNKHSLTLSTALAASTAVRRLDPLIHAGARSIDMWKVRSTIHLEAWFKDLRADPDQIVEWFVSSPTFAPRPAPIHHPRLKPPAYYPFAIGSEVLNLRLREYDA